jgi:signal transduction histidine kinase/DNA-binding response OmpR family regulator
MTSTSDSAGRTASNPPGRLASWLQPQALWGSLAGGLLALALLGSAPVSPLVGGAWQALLAALLPTSVLAAPVTFGSSLGWGVTIWAVVAVGVVLVGNGPVHRGRLAALCAGLTAAVVALSLVGRAFSSADASPLLAVAVLWSAVAGRVAYARWQRWNDRRLAEQQRQVRQAMQQVRADFLQQIARDLRSPVNSVVGVADLLAETALDLDQRRHMNVFKRSADALTRLVDDLNDLARIETQKFTLKSTPLGLVTLLHDQIATIRPEADAKGLQLQLSLSADLPRTVHGDVRRLGQVLSHVLGQAVRGTRTGRVTVEVRPHAKDSDLVRFTVTDTSLSPMTGRLASLVEPFEVPGQDARARLSAIGQALAERLVELMGGKLTVRHSDGKGTCVIFSVLLPAKAPAVAAPSGETPRASDRPAARSEPASPEPAGGTAASGGDTVIEPVSGHVSVLLVDDNFSTRELIESMLDRKRYAVVPCANGREALEALETAPFDIVLMDLDMPELDGWSAMRILRRLESEKRLRRTPVIALGSAPFEAERQKALDAGFDEHLCKPLRKSRLLDSIARIIALPPKMATPAPAERQPARYEQRDALNLLAQDGMVDVQTSVANLGGDASVYLDAIEHLAPALANWPTRFRDALNRREIERARQMALDMQGILEIVGAGPCAAALGRMAAVLGSQQDLPSHAAALGDLDGHLLPLLAALQQAAERIRAGRSETPRREQGHNSAF